MDESHETAAVRDALIEAEKMKAVKRRKRKRKKQDNETNDSGWRQQFNMKHCVKEEIIEAAEDNVESEESNVFHSQSGSGSEPGILDPSNYLETVISSFPIKTEADIDRLNKIQDLIDQKMLEVASRGKRRPPMDGVQCSGGETNAEEPRPPKKKKSKKEKKRTMIATQEHLVQAALERVEGNRDNGRRKKLIDMAKSSLCGEKSKRKKSKEKGRCKKSVEEEHRENINASSHSKFDWEGAILAIISKKGGRTKISKLRKKVISSYQKQRDRGSKTDSELQAKFDKKLRRCKKVKLEEEYVLQVDGGNDCSVTDMVESFVESTAVPLVSKELREICSAHAVKVEPVLAPPSPIPGPSRIGTMLPRDVSVSPPMSPVHQRSFSVIRSRSRSPTPPSSLTTPNSVVAPSPRSRSPESRSVSLRRSTRSTKSVSSYCYSPSSSLGSDKDLICEAFSSGEDDSDVEFVPNHEDDDDYDHVLDDDEVEAAEEENDCLRPCPSDFRVKEEAKEIKIEIDPRDECAENTRMEELPDNDDSMDGKHRFVNQWICDQGESGFGESIAGAETEGVKHSKDDFALKTFRGIQISTELKREAKNYSLEKLLGMTGLEKACPRLRMDSGCDHLEGVDLISIAEKLPRYNCRFDSKEDSLKMVVDWISLNENDFLVPNFQFIPPNPLALRLRVAEIEEMMEASPQLDLGPFSAAELASIVQRHALLIRSVKLGSKQSFSLSSILAGVGNDVQGPARLTAGAIAVASFVGRPMLSYRTIASILGILIRFFASMGNVRTKFTAALKRKAFEYLKWHPKKYRDCIRDLNLQFVVDPRTLRRLFKEYSRNKKVDGLSTKHEETMGDENDSTSSKEIRDMIQVRQTLRTVMEFMGSTKVTAFADSRLKWKKFNLHQNVGRTKQSIKKQWSRICPVVSRYCAGVSLDASASEIPILDHICSNVDSLDEIDISELQSSFPFETGDSLSDLLHKVKKKMAALSETEDADFKSKMTTIITGWPKSSATKQRIRTKMIVLVYKEVSEQLETKWAAEGRQSSKT